MMKTRLCLFFILIFSTTVLHTPAEDHLWQKSLDLFSLNSKWHPRTMLVQTREYDDSGKLKSTTYTEIEYRIDDEGELKSEILRAVKDGKDITAKQKRGRRREGNSFMISPFNPEFQESIEISPTNNTKRVGNSQCRGYKLSLEYEKHHYTGTAWLEKITGAPLLLTLNMESLPKFLDSMTMTFHYTFRDNRTWYATKIEMEGSGTILFQKKIFHSETTMEDHFMYSPPGGKQ